MDTWPTVIQPARQVVPNGTLSSLRFSLQFSNRKEKQTKTQKTLDGGIIETRSFFLIVDGTKCPGDDSSLSESDQPYVQHFHR